MRPRPFHAAITVLSISAALVADHSRAASLRDAPATNYSWQVGVGPAPAEAYKSVSGMGLDVEPVRDPNTRPPTYRAGKKTWAPVRFVQAMGDPGGRAVMSNRFDTDLGSDVVKIVFEPTTTDVIATAPADAKLPSRPIPGPTKVGKVTFTFASSASIAEWSRSLATGTAPVKEITINSRSALGVVVRTMVLKHALLTSYACDGQQAMAVVQPDAVTVSGPANKVLADWIQASVDGTKPRRDVKVTWGNPLTHVAIGSTTLKGAFITEVAWATLDAQSTLTLNDTVTVQPDSVDPLP